MGELRELTDEEVIYLYRENLPINASYAAKAIPVVKLIELLDMKKTLQSKNAALVAALRHLINRDAIKAPKDHACHECVGYTEDSKGDFLCSYHLIEQILVAHNEQGDGG